MNDVIAPVKSGEFDLEETTSMNSTPFCWAFLFHLAVSAKEVTTLLTGGLTVGY